MDIKRSGKKIWFFFFETKAIEFFYFSILRITADGNCHLYNAVSLYLHGNKSLYLVLLLTSIEPFSTGSNLKVFFIKRYQILNHRSLMQFHGQKL